LLQKFQSLAQIKDHKHAYAYAHKNKPTLDLLGLNVAFEEILQVEAWTKVEEKKEISIILSRA
jgi:hypothetical protein